MEEVGNDGEVTAASLGECTSAGADQLLHRTRTQQAITEAVEASQAVAANRMLERSGRLLPAMVVGDNVAVSVDKVDRGPLDPPTLLAVIMKVSGESLYEIGTLAGRLTGPVSRNLLSKTCNSLKCADVPDVTVGSLRQMVKLISTFGGQGYLRCACTAQCKTKRCKCKKGSVMCNSRCHPGRSCDNHD